MRAKDIIRMKVMTDDIHEIKRKLTQLSSLCILSISFSTMTLIVCLLSM